MNYKDKLLSELQEGLLSLKEIYEEEGKSTTALEKAYDITFKILKTRFDNELKQYNNNEEKAYDHFIARKNLDYLRIYIEEFLLLDKKESEVDFYKAVRKHMRHLLHHFQFEI